MRPGRHRAAHPPGHAQCEANGRWRMALPMRFVVAEPIFISLDLDADRFRCQVATAKNHSMTAIAALLTSLSQ
jgi:hypothetical protein